MECTVCMEPISRENRKQLSCGHCLHRSCAKTLYIYSDRRPTCPVCRKPFSMRFKQPEQGEITTKIAELKEQQEQESLREVREQNERHNRELIDLMISFESVMTEAIALLGETQELQRSRTALLSYLEGNMVEGGPSSIA